MRPLDTHTLELEGCRLIEASAGTGKTYAITTLVLRLLLEQKLPLSKILVVTYTRAATAELKARIRLRISELLGAMKAGDEHDDPTLRALVHASSARGSLEDDKQRLERALYSMDEASIFTIHGFCQRVLSDFAFESGTPFDLELMSQSESLVAEVAHDYWTYSAYRIEESVYKQFRRAGPEAIASLVTRTARASLPRILPEDHSSEAPDVECWHAKKAAAASHFAEGRHALKEELAGAGIGMQSRWLDGWFEKTARALETALPPLEPDLLKAAEYLTARSVTARADKKKKPAPQHPLLDALQDWLDEDALHTGWVEQQTRLLLAGGIQYAHREMVRRTRELGATTFDQMLTDTHAALTGPSRDTLKAALRERYTAALIDEFQDTDPTQYAIFRESFTGLPLLLIGDPKQAIYSFRGADIFAYLRARADAAGHVYGMHTNYRSDPRVIAGVNHLFGSAARPFRLEGIDYEQVEARPKANDALHGPRSAGVELLWMPSPDKLTKAEAVEQIAARVATDIVTELERGPALGESSSGRAQPLSARDIAVLCRTNDQAQLVQQALAERGVPAVLHGDSSVFDSADAMELERLLSAMAEPRDGQALRSALAGSYIGLDAVALEALAENDVLWERQHEDMGRYHRLWVERGFIQALRTCLSDHGVDARLLGQTDGTRRWTNLQHLAELAQQASVQGRLGPGALIRFMRTMRSDVATRAEIMGDSCQLRLESNADAVTLTTVHRSKGLEYPVVYCPFLWDGRLLAQMEKRYPLFHARSEGHPVCLDLGSPEKKAHEDLAGAEALSEGLRLLYVGLTRAKHSVRVVCGPLPKHQTGPLHYLLQGGGDSEALLQRTKKQSPGEFLEVLEALAAGSAGSLAVQPLCDPSPVRRGRQGETDAAVEARRPKRGLEAGRRTTSFSALTQTHDTQRGRAKDAGAAPAPELESAIDGGLDRDSVALLTPSSAAAEITLHAFPQGAQAGTLIHEVLEHSDFSSDQADLEERLTSLLPARGFESRWAATLAEGLHSALAAPLFEGGPALRDVAADKQLREMEFIFHADAHGNQLDPRSLADALRRHGAPTPNPRYAARLGQLRFGKLDGFVRGFVDLIFEHEGRYYVVDHKSNHLGTTYADYAGAGIAHAMSEHHYYLQYLLYSVALHRHLAQRVAGYSYADHFGGALYLFLRGMHPERPGSGIYQDRPTEALILELDATLCEPGGRS